jgi:hypothetical protein
MIEGFKNYIRTHWKWLLPLVFGLAVLFWYRYDLAEFVRTRLGIELPENPRPFGVNDLQWCEQNYGEEMHLIADELELPYSYLMSLAVLECSGEKPAGHRFEQHVYRELVKVKEGKRRKYESVRKEHLESLSDDELRELASSWGPFQLMGYKIIALGVSIDDIRDEEVAAMEGAKWIQLEYGRFLNKKKWKDAFHIHNTGKRFPLSGRSQTHDPYYVSDGLRYMKYFDRKP